MSDQYDDMLTPEEKRLAALLASDATKRRPNPALDAAILNAAREAVAPKPDVKVTPITHNKWAPYAGLAATVALSGFLLLRYGNVDEIPNVPASSDMSADSTPSPAEASAPVAEDAMANEVAAGSQAAVSAPAPAPPKPQTAKSTTAHQVVPPVQPPPPPPVVFDDPAPMVYQAPPPAPPAPPSRPAPPAPPARTAPQAAPVAAEDADFETIENPTTAGFRSSAAMQKSVGSVTVTGTRVVTVPVSEDAKLDKDTWIKRIELRLAQGDRAGAKESLNALLKRHPNAELPPALEALR